MVKLLLNLTGYRSEANLLNAHAIEPTAGDGAFLRPIIERLMASRQKSGRPSSGCQDSLIAYELDDERAERARALTAGIFTDRGVERPLAEHLAADGYAPEAGGSVSALRGHVVTFLGSRGKKI